MIFVTVSLFTILPVAVDSEPYPPVITLGTEQHIEFIDHTTLGDHQRIHIRTSLDDTDIRDGYWFKNDSMRHAVPVIEIPSRARLTEDGVHIEWTMVTIQDAMVPPGATVRLPLRSELPIVGLGDARNDKRVLITGENEVPERRQATVIVDYDPDGSPFQGLDAGLTEPILTDVSRLLSSLLNDDQTLTFEVTWDSFDGDLSDSLGLAFVESDDVRYNQIRNSYLVQPENNDDNRQDIVYDNLPLGSEIRFHNGFGNDQTDDIETPRALLQALALGGAAPQMRVVLNSNSNWDPTAIDGNAGGHNLHAVVLHEFLHHLGFTSMHGQTTAFAARITPWDIFRFGADEWPGGIRTVDFANERRELELDTQAVFSGRTFDDCLTFLVSDGIDFNGNDEGSAHWSGSQETTDFYIDTLPPFGVDARRTNCLGNISNLTTISNRPSQGIMAPGSNDTAGYPLTYNEWLSYADLTLLDIVGWDIDMDNLPDSIQPPSAPVIPADGAEITLDGEPILFDWDDYPDATRYAWILEDVTAEGPGTQVAVFERLAASELTVDSALFDENRQYTWRIVADNLLYFAKSPSYALSVASTVDCSPADVNDDGAVTPTDFGAWLTCYNSGLPCADVNGDGMVSPTDFGAWLTLFNSCSTM